MAKRPLQPPEPRLANVSVVSIPTAIAKLERRISELTSADTTQTDQLWPFAQSLCTKINATLGDVFGLDTVEYRRAEAHPTSFLVGRVVAFGRGGHSPQEELQAFVRGRDRATAKLRSEIDLLRERQEDAALEPESEPASSSPTLIYNSEIFVVHGQDEAARAEVARFLEGRARANHSS